MNVGWRVLLYAAAGRRTESVRTCTLDLVAIGRVLRNRGNKNREEVLRCLPSLLVRRVKSNRTDPGRPSEPTYTKDHRPWCQRDLDSRKNRLCQNLLATRGSRLLAGEVE